MGKTWDERIRAMEVPILQLINYARQEGVDPNKWARILAEAFCDGDTLMVVNGVPAGYSPELECLIMDGWLVPLRKETDE